MPAIWTTTASPSPHSPTSPLDPHSSLPWLLRVQQPHTAPASHRHRRSSSAFVVAMPSDAKVIPCPVVSPSPLSRQPLLCLAVFPSSNRRTCATRDQCGSVRRALGVASMARCLRSAVSVCAWPACRRLARARPRRSLTRILRSPNVASSHPARVAVSCSWHAVVERVSTSRTRNSP
jgi:hypothetical protein